MIALKWDNRIYTNIKTKLDDVCDNVVRQSSLNPTKFPTVLLKQIEGSDTGIDFQNNCGSVLGYEVQVYTEGSNKYESAKNIMSLVNEEFSDMGFSNIYFSQIDNDNDPNIYRVAARYRRIIGSGNVIRKL